LRNSIILTVYASRPWHVIVYSVIQRIPVSENPLDLEAGRLAGMMDCKYLHIDKPAAKIA